MPITNSKRAKTNPATSLSNVRIRRSKTQTVIPMLKEKVAPAGTYTSRIAAVTASKIDGTNADAVDITYELTANDGKVVQGRIRYEIGGYHFDRLGDALIDAGLPDGSPITDAVDIQEEITIVYPHRGALAKIKDRRPLAASAAPAQKAAVRSTAVVAEDDDEAEDDYDEDDEEDLLDVDDDF